ncbi:hypothetical protein OMP94_07910 [Methylophaga sp. OBS3]|nr:hypothetical protein [Methylophaga sp. OBS3]
MQIRRHHFKWLYLLAALVLSLQTFAIWHDTTHPFHKAEAQCERLEAISHTPVVNATPTLIVATTYVVLHFVSGVEQHYTAKSRYLPQLIRGPPVFS